MLVSGYAVQDCLIKSSHYKQSGESETELDITQQNGDIFIEMSGKYDFRVTHVLIEMTEAENKVNVNWSYNVKILKGSCHKYNLNKDLVKILHRRLRSSIGTIVTDSQRQLLHQHPENAHSFMHIHASKDTNGMIGHLCMFKKSTTMEII
jgi:hypothetical protein